ncbi:Cyclin [Pyrenophora tritici-repentis]|nr:g2 mitotic-specific cyclin-b protein [Pyrenophora tritici-repentis]KAF7453818.1 g2 mitotic-specific cyclin-b protein [Pyrenophora tritici-repentis]KAG9387579.1 g2 mitotic-specific cyclin-b protein [Pyrenophora tritici-repentis]KAI1545933.1 Cyclin [Pyrenophora tritici-repentis]KAI1555582.1 Cyclin [Pyrenophora tritici-repentis]
MPPAARALRQRAVTNENDENATTTRLTRAKAANLGATESAADVPKKALQTKKSTATLAGAATRKRAALGDVSNVTKTDALGAGAKDGKKTLATKGQLSKAAQPTKVQKQSRANTTRSILEPKDKNTSELKKRQASGNGISGAPAKKRPKENVPEPDVKEVKEVKEAKQVNGTKKEVEAPVTEVFYDGPDLDKEDVDDPLMVSEYVVEIFEYLKELEIATMANPDYMDSQTELEWKMRGILVDWLLEVHTRFRLLPETLFLAVNIIDRFLSAKIVQLDRLQLVGVTAMFIASKYEEVLSPHVQNFRHVADDGFTEEEILSAERFVLAALNYDLSYPNPMNFLRRISKADNYDIQTRTLGKYLLEIGCLDHRFLAHPPSQVAAAAMYLSRLVLERGPWDATLTHYAGYTEEEIQPVLQLMIDYLSGPVVHEAFFKKYASKKFLKASIVLRKWAKDYVSAYGNALEEEPVVPSKTKSQR